MLRHGWPIHACGVGVDSDVRSRSTEEESELYVHEERIWPSWRILGVGRANDLQIRASLDAEWVSVPSSVPVLAVALGGVNP